MSRFFCSIVFVFFIRSLFAQQSFLEYGDYSFDPKPTYVDSFPTKELNTIVLKHKQVIEYAYEDDRLQSYSLVHKRIRVLTDKSMESNNKVYLNMNVHSVKRFVRIF